MAIGDLVAPAVRRGVRLGLSAATVLLALGVATGAGAQEKDKAKAAPKAAPAAKADPKAAAKGAPAAGAAQQSAWVKLCEQAPFVKKDAEGKDVREARNICLTHHERLDGNTGMVLVSAALRQIDGQDKQHLMVMVPLGMALSPGIRAAVYPKDLWDKVQKNEKIDEKLLKPIELKYSICHPAGCTAETEAPADLVEQMKTGGGLMVLAINAGSQPIAFPVPLVGFPQSHAGAPVDNKAYAQARGQLMEQIRQRQAQMIEEYKKQQQTAAGTPPAAAGAAPAVPAPKKQ